MASGLDLFESRIDRIDFVGGIAKIHFSHAYIHKSKGRLGAGPGTDWSREAELMLREAALSKPLPPLPNTIIEGFLEVGGIRHEVIPLPFERKVGARLFLQFADGAEMEIVGEKPVLNLLGVPIYLGDLS